MKQLNYIGSKNKLLDWIYENIKSRTSDKKFFDVFAGSGAVSHYMRLRGYSVKSNDAELYSYIITRALTCTTWTQRLKGLVEELNKPGMLVGNITRYYSPYDTCERMFFTVDNAQRIDFMRHKIATMDLADDERVFLLASLIVAADGVSNITAVYGAYLKRFKVKAVKPIVVEPIHTCETPYVDGSRVYNSDALELDPIDAHIVYLDPPYNQRQYSKNYFPLNIIAQDPSAPCVVHGKTGIPDECFSSSFCRTRDVRESFEKLVNAIHAKWIFVSYNSESLLSRDELAEILGTRGKVEVLEKEYKKFKSSVDVDDDTVIEYLYCVKIE